jgi:hypothetical protein
VGEGACGDDDAVKTITALSNMVMSLGGTMEQDAGGRVTVWQCVAPKGRVWKSGAKHVRLEWMPRVSTSKEVREQSVREAAEIVALGHRAMTEQERFECDE